MATVNVIKNTPNQAVVKILGPGSATVDLASLTASYQLFDRGNTKVTINSIYLSANGFVTIARNSTTIVKLSEATENWLFSQGSGFVLDEQSNANIAVNFQGTGTDGTVLLALSKVQGYSPNTQTSIGYDGVQQFISRN